MAVYTHVTSEDLNLFLQDYEIGKLIEYVGISEGVENTNYKLKTEKGSFILTIYEDRVEKKDIPFFLEYMFFLSSSELLYSKSINEVFLSLKIGIRFL